MAQRIMVTGCTGFFGRHLIPFLKDHLEGAHLSGTSRTDPEAGQRLLLDEYYSADLTAPEQVRRLIEAARPDAVIHCASLRTGSLAELLNSNVLATNHLLEALRESKGTDARVLIIGSSAEIGFCRPDELPLAENAACRPVDLYGISKLAQSVLAQAAHLEHGQPIVRLRAFNLIGPGLPSTLLPGRCAEMLAQRLQDGSRKELIFGALGTRRDYTDIRDVCRAIFLALHKGRAGQLYHVGSGRAFSGHEVVQAFLKASERELKGLNYLASSSGESTVTIQIADAGHALEDLGWRPEITFEQSVQDMWEGIRLGERLVAAG